MTTAPWPAGLPQCPILNGFQETPQPNTVAFNPETGTPKVRRRSTAKGWLTDMVYRMSNAQLLTFKSFYETTLEDGSLPFTQNHPVTKVNYSWMFNPDSQPQIQRTAPGFSTVSFQLVRLP